MRRRSATRATSKKRARCERKRRGACRRKEEARDEDRERRTQNAERRTKKLVAHPFFVLRSAFCVLRSALSSAGFLPRQAFRSVRLARHAGLSDLRRHAPLRSSARVRIQRG